jgi:tryptophan synthase alpha chain
MHRIDQLFATKQKNILSVYFTAGFPKLNDTLPVMQHLQDAGADLIEVGMPFSDPLADGPTIQESNLQALNNGMTIHALLEQLKDMREQVTVPVILMGYMNPIMQYGLEPFCKACKEAGVDGLILPDLPMQEYLNSCKAVFDAYGLYNTFLITPQTAESRIRTIDENTHGFIYMVSSASITGAKKEITPEQIAYFDRINAMNLTNPRLIGFGISSRHTFNQACEYGSGAIIGSAFIRLLKNSTNLKEDIHRYIGEVKGIRQPVN